MTRLVLLLLAVAQVACTGGYYDCRRQGLGRGTCDFIAKPLRAS